MESLLQVPEWSTPLHKEAGRHSRTPVWLHREHPTQTQHKTEANHRWKWREVTQEKQRSPTRPGRDGVCKAQLALKLVLDVKGNKKGLYSYISSESQGKYELAAEWGG